MKRTQTFLRTPDDNYTKNSDPQSPIGKKKKPTVKVNSTVTITVTLLSSRSGFAKTTRSTAGHIHKAKVLFQPFFFSVVVVALATSAARLRFFSQISVMTCRRSGSDYVNNRKATGIPCIYRRSKFPYASMPCLLLLSCQLFAFAFVAELLPDCTCVACLCICVCANVPM